MYNGEYVGKLSQFALTGKSKVVMTCEFVWRNDGGIMRFTSVSTKRFLAEYEAESGEFGHWRGIPIDFCSEKQVQFRWHDNLVYEASSHDYEDGSGYELQALRPLSPNIIPELQMNTPEKRKKRKRKLQALEPRKRKKFDEKMQKTRKILEVLESEPVKERNFETGRLVDVHCEDGSWICMRPVHYRGEGRYVLISEDKGDASWDMTEVHEDFMREKLAPSFQWVGHDVFVSHGVSQSRATIYKVDTKLRFIRVKLAKTGKILEFAVDYDRITPSTKLEAIMNNQREKLEKKSEGTIGRKHEVRFQSPKPTQDHGQINAPLDAGCVKFTPSLQQKTMDHAGVVFVNDEEREDWFPHDPDLDDSLPQTLLHWTVNPPVDFFEQWWGKVQEKAFNAPRRSADTKWHREFREEYNGEQLVGYRLCKEEQFDRNAVHCVFAHWARIKRCGKNKRIYYHDTLANVTQLNFTFSIGLRPIISKQEQFHGAGAECLSVVTPARARQHGCSHMALHAADWTLLSFYERYGYITKWGIVFENISTRKEIQREETLWEDDKSTNHAHNVYMARLLEND